jgi:phosphoenolpyruvate---glycerone phosphotransferase subunit DhaK
MKKFHNGVDRFLEDSLSGFGAAHADLVRVQLDPAFIVRRTITPGKVALISGGGSGHEPMHGGFVGRGMLDAACPGQVFTSPTPNQMAAAAEAAESGAGVLFIVKNYSGDRMNFEMASEFADFENATVMTNDDVAVENSSHTTGRRGVAGTVIVEKIVGSLAETGADLETCRAMGERVNARNASMGVALTSCTVPAAGKPTFEIGVDEMEVGVGIHGEPGRRRSKIAPSSDIVHELMGVILENLKPNRGAEALLIVNGLGNTPLSELYVLFNDARQELERAGVSLARSLVGNYTTALDMAGASLTVCLLDEEMKQHWDAPVHTAAMRWGV